METHSISLWIIAFVVIFISPVRE